MARLKHLVLSSIRCGTPLADGLIGAEGRAKHPVGITPQAIDQFFVIRVVEPEATGRIIRTAPEVHEIVPCSAERASDKKRNFAIIIWQGEAVLYSCMIVAS